MLGSEGRLFRLSGRRRGRRRRHGGLKVRAAEESLRAELRKELGESVYLITPSSYSQADCRSTISTNVACWRRSRSQCWLKQQPRLLRQEDHNRGSIYYQYVSLLMQFPSNSDGVQYTSPYSRYCIIHHLAIDAIVTIPLTYRRDSSAYHLHCQLGTLRHTVKENLIRRGLLRSPI